MKRQCFELQVHGVCVATGDGGSLPAAERASGWAMNSIGGSANIRLGTPASARAISMDRCSAKQ